MEKPVHFRRCHVCGGTNHVDDDRVEKCQHCGKSLAPFYYFDDRFMVVQSDNTLRPPMVEGEYSPVHGLTAYWESF